MREGSEVALFLYGLVAAGGTTARDLARRLAARPRRRRRRQRGDVFRAGDDPARRLFAVTTALITFLAAGLAAQAVMFLQQAGLVDGLERHRVGHLGDLSDTSLFGRVLHTLIGYSDQPSVLQVVVYAVTLAAIFTLTKAFAPRAVARRPEAPPPQSG